MKQLWYAVTLIVKISGNGSEKGLKMKTSYAKVEMGGAVAVTSDCTIEKHNPRVVIRELNMPEVKGHDITMAWRRSNYNPAVALFMELVEGHRV